MTDYLYRAIGSDGKTKAGELSAASHEDALRLLQEQGVTPISINLAGEGGSSGELVAKKHAGSEGVSTEDLLAVTSELAVLLRAGLPLDRSLKVLVGFIHVPKLKTVLSNVLDQVKHGGSLSHSMSMHQGVFGDFYLNMIRAAEAGGHLPDALERLTEHLERLKQLRQSVLSALIYPAILVVVAILSIGLMLVFVVPQFESLFADMGDALPAPTKFVLAAAHFLKSWGWGLIIAVTLGFFGVRGWLRTEAGQARMDRVLLRIPLLGALLTKYEITRFSRTMGTLLSNGVSMLESIKIAANSIENSTIRQALALLPAHIKQGGRMADAIHQSGIMPPLGVHMIQIGEETGRLDAMFMELARIYDEQVQNGVKRSLTLFEPILILSLGAMIALIIISILMGILSVNELAV